MVKLRHPERLGLHLRVALPGNVTMGPGRADLLEAIKAHGSISAAGRAIGMSYKRAWELIDQMNTAFAEPVVDASRGGPTGGGAQVTPAGEKVLALYRQIELEAAKSAAAEVAALTDMLANSATLGKTAG